MNAPASIWLDERVARTLPRVKDEELAERGVAQIRYFSEEEVAGMVRRVGPPAEMVVQIAALVEQVGEVREDRLIVLTNLGRILERKGPAWADVDLPDLEA